MRYPASEKLEIIRLVENSHLSARRTLQKLNASSSGLPVGFLRWVDRCWPRTLQAKRSETENFAMT